MAPKSQKTSAAGANSEAQQPSEPKGKVPEIHWLANGGKLVWALLTEMERRENRSVFFGKAEKTDNTSGDSKAKICKKIGEVILPEYFKINPSAVRDRVKNKIDNLVSTYKKHAASLRKTGEGLRDDENASKSASEVLEFYIPPSGPTSDTPEHAKNLWEKIVKEFPFFPRLHAVYSMRPNVVPIVVTTGVGPQGPKTVWHQHPDGAPMSPHASSEKPIPWSPTPEPPNRQGNGGAVTTPITPTPQRTFGVDCTNTAGVDRKIPPSSKREVEKTPTKPKRGPKPSSTSRANKLQSIQTVPQKRTVTEMLIDVSRQNFELLRMQAFEKEKRERIALLMDEFKLSLITATEYQAKKKEIEAEKCPVFSSASQPTPAKKRRHHEELSSDV